MSDPRRNPRAAVLKHGVPLNVDPDWRITLGIQAALDGLSEPERDHIPGAKALAEDMGETCPDAWVWYIGWAYQQFEIERRDMPSSTREQVLERVGRRPAVARGVRQGRPGTGPRS